MILHFGKHLEGSHNVVLLPQNYMSLSFRNISLNLMVVTVMLVGNQRSISVFYRKLSA